MKQAVAGPSTASDVGPSTELMTHPLPAKPRSAHPDHPRPAKRKRAPPLPAPPTAPSAPGGTTATHPHLPIKVLQGVGTKRTDTTKPGFGREVIFVTRKTSLGALMGRCRSLMVDEGYTHLIIHALGAAIPHALLLLHAVLDMLPFPRGPRGLWYEIRTGTAECVDGILPDYTAAAAKSAPARPAEGKTKKSKRKGKDKARVGDAESSRKEGHDQAIVDGEASSAEAVASQGETGAEEEPIHSWLAGIGSIEAIAPTKQTRMTSSIKIDLYIGPKPSTTPVKPAKQPKQSKPGEGRARPNKQRRQALLAKRRAKRQGEEPEGSGVEEGMDEEDMFNAGAESEEEAVEEVEMR